MKMIAFSVYDSKSEVYMLPFFSNSTASGLRLFSDATNEPKSVFYRHPGDYTLFEIGTYDDNKGIMLAYNAQINHGTAITFKNIQEPTE